MKMYKKISLALVFVLLTATIPVFSIVHAFGPVTIWQQPNSSVNAKYPRAIKLENQSNASDNGKLLASEQIDAYTSLPIHLSSDRGQSWSTISTVSDAHAGERLVNANNLYELPQAIGSMPKGTILFTPTTADSSGNLMIELYKSNDVGQTWQFVSKIVIGGQFAGATLASQGVWEPILLVANNKLICFYTDETDPNHNQKVVHKTTTDGVNWSSVVDDVRMGLNYRPGMAAITKMGNGNYMLAYEIVGYPNSQVYYKISSNPESWTPDNVGSPINSPGYTIGSTPYLIWTPLGGPNGSLVLSAWSDNHLFVNYNNGVGDWTALDSSIPTSYSRSLVYTGGSSVGVLASDATDSKIVFGTVDIGVASSIQSGHTYKLLPQAGEVNNQALDVTGWGSTNGTNVETWADYDNPAQKWKIVDVGGGYYKLLPKSGEANNQALDVAAWGSTNGSNVETWEDNGTPAQKWKIVSVGGGYYKLLPQCGEVNHQALDVTGWGSTNGTNVETYEDNGTPAQKWKLVEVTPNY
ncbi:RICIN domain-containing protein [Paenibacillus albus]|uniref:Ricin B lectin domain-containing protein n=1 Tax=Paenibacillus albus TaxID=2495582 RepID=A0A3S9A6X5_9BACL|nr:RICIN domain-containing protein [Paenibacillus albus]AZN41346.1 hypothetical protein EJC50_17960 [Paenibacillus albus]